MKYILLAPAMCFALTIAIAAQGYVYGDRTTKKYYSIECGEVEKIDRNNIQGFKSTADAEKAGFVKGDKCSKSTAQPIFVGTAEEPSNPGSKVTVGELRRGSVTIEMIRTDFRKYEMSLQKFVGTINVSAYFGGKYEGKQDDMWAFHLCDQSGCGYFYMFRTIRSNSIRALIVNPTRDVELIWTCQYRPEEMYMGDILGELIGCTPRKIVE